MQGRSFKNNEVTQEICDKSRIFKLVGSDRYVCKDYVCYITPGGMAISCVRVCLLIS